MVKCVSTSTDPSESAVQVSSLLRRPSNRARSRPGRPPSHLGALVSALTRLNANLYFAPTAAVRSPRLSELEVAHAVNVTTNGGGGDRNGKKPYSITYVSDVVYAWRARIITEPFSTLSET